MKKQAKTKYAEATEIIITSSSEVKSNSSSLLFKEYVRSTLSEKEWSQGETFQVLVFGELIKLAITQITPEPTKSIITTNTQIIFDFPQSKAITTSLTTFNQNISLKIFQQPLFLLTKIIEMHLHKESNNVTFIRGALLIGPPGCGKTTLINYIASNKKLPLYTINAATFTSITKKGESSLQSIFTQAVATQPSIIFLDDLDYYSPQFDQSDNDQKTFTSDLLERIDSLSKEAKVIIIGASGKAEAVNSQLKRGGRLDIEIAIPMPSIDERVDILESVFKNMNISIESNDAKICAQESIGYSCSDLVGIATHSYLNSVIRENTTGTANVKLQDLYKALDDVRPNTIKDLILQIPKVRWNEVGGNKDIIQQIKQLVEWPLKYSDAFKRMGIKPSQGILLYGPPGCSKTLIAKALATECALNFIAIKGPELMNKYVGESEKAIREIFRKARLSAPSIIFFDEIDAIATKRGTDSEGNNVSDRMLCQLLNEMDGIEESGRVIVIAATNRPDILDNALLRPGRIDRILYVPLPNYDARLEILQIYTSKMPIDETVELSKIAEKLDGYTGAEVSLICKEAAMFGLEADINIAKLNSTHFSKAIDKVKPRLKKEDLQKYQAFTGEPIFSLQLKLKN